MSANPIIEVEDLSFAYGEHAVLQNVSLSVRGGEFLGVIGPNGGGKTTLLRILLGLETDYQGRVRVFGEEPSSGTEWRRRVGVVPQHRDLPLRFPVRAWEVVEMGTFVRRVHFSRAERKERAADALALVGATAYADRPLRQLSGGQKQRILVARALAAKPDLLLLDEPTVGVDLEGQDLLMEWIARWRREREMTVVLISHDVGVIAPLVDKLACLNVQLFFHDRPDLLTGEAVQKAYGCPAEVLFHSRHAVPHVVLKEHKSP
jgi:zinc transport system ATP-binding protein